MGRLSGRRHVVMIATSFETQGGVSSVTRMLRDSDLFTDWNVRYIATHCDGPRSTKLRIAISAWLQYIWILALRRAELAHVHMSSDASFWRKSTFILPSLLLRVPVAVHVHGADFLEFAAQGSWMRRSMVRFVLNNCRAVVALSERWRDGLLAVCPTARVVVIPNPVADCRHGSNQFRRPRTLLFLGNIGVRKGSYVLLAALARLKDRHPDLTLLCGGDGDHETFLRRAQELGVQGQVRLLGWVNGAAKARLFARATAFVLPSHSEGLPMALLEAMGAGVPVISTPVGGIPDVVRNGVDGLLVPAGDVASLAGAIDQLLTDTALRNRIGRAGRERVVQQHSLRRVVALTSELYADLGATRARGCDELKPTTH